MTPYYEDSKVALFHVDAVTALSMMEPKTVQCCVTSPPYWGLRDYGTAGQIGLESTPEEYVADLVDVFRQVRRVLRPDGTLWLNLGDCYCSRPGQRKETDVAGPKQKTKTASLATPSRTVDDLKPKNLVGVPWRVAFALQADGWYLRSDIIWAKPNAMPESVSDRPTRSHEYIFLLTKSEKYYYDHEAIKEPAVAGHASGNGYKRLASLSFCDENGSRGNDDGSIVAESRNKRDVWTVNTEPFPETHFATFPPALILPCILAGSAVGDTVLDPFSGAGTTALVAKANGRRAIGIDLNAEYLDMSIRRVAQEVLAL